MFLGTFGLQPKLVRTPRMPKPTQHPGASHPPTHPGATHPPGRHPPTHSPGRHPSTHPPGRHPWNSQNAENECFWAHSGFSPICEQAKCRKRMLLGTLGLWPNLVQTAGMPKTKIFGHIRASGQFGPNNQNAQNECFWPYLGFRPLWSKPPTHPPGRHPPTHPPGRHASARAPPTHPATWAPPRQPPTRAPQTHPPTGCHQTTHRPGRHPSTRAPPTQPPTRAPPMEQPECRIRMFLGTFRLGPKLVRTAGMPKTDVFGHIPACAQFGPNSRNAEYECFWAHQGFSPIWCEQPECRKRKFLGTFGLQPDWVQTARMPKTNVFGHIPASAQVSPNSQNAETHPAPRRHPSTHHPGATHPPRRHPPTNPPRHHPPTHPPGRHPSTRANSQNAENECFWAHSGVRPISSKPGATHPPTHPPTHPGANHPGATHPPTHPPTRAPRMFLGTFRLQPNLVRTAGMPKTNDFGHIRASAQFGPNSRNAEKECFWAHSGFSPIWSKPGATHPGGWVGGWVAPGLDQIGLKPECAQKHSFSAFRLFGPNWAEARMCPKRFVFGILAVRRQFGPNSRIAKNESFWAHSGFRPIGPNSRNAENECFWADSGFSPIWSEKPECQKRIFFGHIRASAQFGPNSRNAENECFWAHSGFRPIWSQPGATHPPNRAPPTRAPPTRAPPTHPPTHPPGRHECFWAHSSFSPISSERPECQKRIFLGTFGLPPNLVRTAGMPKTYVFGHIRASAQFGPSSRNAKNESFWAHSGFGPIWSEQPDCRKRMFLGTFGLQANLVPTGRHPPNPPGRHLPGRHPPTHPPTHPGATNVFGHIPASAQFRPNSRNAKNQSFWAPSGFSPIWSEQPECRKRMFLGTFGLQANLVPTGRHPPTHPPTQPPGRHLPGRHPPTQPPTHPGATNVFGHLPASAQFRPKSRNAKNESFWAPSGFGPIWSEQPECRKRMFLGTFGLQANLVTTGRHPSTHPGATYPGATHPPSHPPTRAPRMFLGTFRLQPNLVRTAGMPKTNVFGHIRASGQFGPNRAPPTHPPTHPPTRAPPTRAPPTNPPTHPPGRHECFWADSGFSPIWSEQPEGQKRIFLGTFGLRPNVVRTAGMPKTNVFGHIRASGQFGPNRAPPTHPPTNPPTRAPPTRAPPTHAPTHPPGRHECFWADSGLSPIWSEQPECQKRIFLGTFGLRPNVVRTAGMPKTNVFGHIRASGQFGPNRAPPTQPPTHPPTRPGATYTGATGPPTHPPTRAPRMFLGTFGLQANLVPTRRQPPTHPGATYPDATHPPTHPPTRAPRMFLGTFRLQPN